MANCLSLLEWILRCSFPGKQRCETGGGSEPYSILSVHRRVYAALFGYADDLLIACPSRGGLQQLVDIASTCAANHNISFSTDDNPTKSKAKTMVMSLRPKKTNPAPIMLNGSRLPWVTQAKYLGCLWNSQRNGHHAETVQKKGIFISRLRTLL